MIHSVFELLVAPFAFRAVYCLCSLYMLALLLRWAAPMLDLDFRSPRLRWIAFLTDPLLEGLRRVMPALGPVDLAPLAGVFLVFVLREIGLSVVAQI